MILTWGNMLNVIYKKNLQIINMENDRLKNEIWNMRTKQPPMFSACKKV